MRISVLIAALAVSANAFAAETPRATDFKWMSGCWGYESGGSSYEEHWLTPSGNTILGIAHRDADGYTRDFDYIRIVTSGTGFDFVSQPKGDPELRYGMTAQKKGSSVTFESLSGLGFPTRITYEYTAPDSLKVRFEGRSEANQPMMNIFPMKRKSCSVN
ncbi:MAG: DUF6265 family protein [Pseudomonadota bacterium]